MSLALRVIWGGYPQDLVKNSVATTRYSGRMPLASPAACFCGWRKRRRKGLGTHGRHGVKKRPRSRPLGILIARGWCRPGLGEFRGPGQSGSSTGLGLETGGFETGQRLFSCDRFRDFSGGFDHHECDAAAGARSRRDGGGVCPPGSFGRPSENASRRTREVVGGTNV